MVEGMPGMHEVLVPSLVAILTHKEKKEKNRK